MVTPGRHADRDRGRVLDGRVASSGLEPSDSWLVPAEADLRRARACIMPPVTDLGLETLLDVVREEFGRVAYGHKAHMKMVDRLNYRLLLEKRINAGLLALTSVDLVTVLVTDAKAAKVSALALSALALLVTVYGLSRSRERLVEQHRTAAQGLWLLREKYMHLVADLRAGAITPAEGRARRDELTTAAAQVYASAPDTDGKSYKAAQRALKVNEELTFSAREIDVMLPEALRKEAISPPKAS